MLRSNRQVLQYGFGVLAFISGFLSLFFWGWSYRELLPLFETFNHPEKHYLPGPVFGISEAGYLLCRVAYLLVFGLSLAGVYAFGNKSVKSLSSVIPTETILFFANKLQQKWRQISAKEKWLLLFTSLVLLAARIMFLFRLPYRVDEITTFDLFVSRGLPGALLFYPVPNNHILFSLLCLPFTWFLTDSFWIVKLPSLLLSTLSFPLIYLALRSCFSFAVTYVGWTGYSFSYFALTYAVNGRGYSLLAVCGALMTITLLKLLQTREVAYWLIYMVSVVAGFYTIPIFVYPFVAVSAGFILVLLAQREWLLFKHFAIASIFAAVGVGLVYTPVVAVSGLDLLFNNRFVQSLSGSNYFHLLPRYLFNRQGIVLGQETIGFYVWLLGSGGLGLWLLFRKRLKQTWSNSGLKPNGSFIFLLASVLPWVLMGVQRVFPEPRIFTFKAFFDFLLLALFFQLVCSAIFRNREKLQLTIMLAGVILYNIYEVWKLYCGLMYW